MRALIYLITFCGFAGWGCLAQETNAPIETDERACTEQDLVGRWQQVAQFVNIKITETNPFFFTNQLFEFSSEGFMRQRSSKKPFEDAEIQMFATGLMTTQFKFIDRNGRLDIIPEMAATQHVIATYILKDIPPGTRKHIPAMKGDIILRYLAPGQQPPVYLTRVLRKMEPKK